MTPGSTPDTKFQSTHSLRSATNDLTLPASIWFCFNPRTPCGVRLVSGLHPINKFLFQSTHSLRSATLGSPPASSEAGVSIHALLAECDHLVVFDVGYLESFNPRTPCGVRPYQFTGFTPTKMFQSTHSLRSATCLAEPQIQRLMVSIHALLAECDRNRQPACLPQSVSIHALLAECDRWASCAGRHGTGFNPRTPCGVRQQVHGRMSRVRSFNPRTPCGVRLCDCFGEKHKGQFQSTHSLRSATFGIVNA